MILVPEVEHRVNLGMTGHISLKKLSFGEHEELGFFAAEPMGVEVDVSLRFFALEGFGLDVLVLSLADMDISLNHLGKSHLVRSSFEFSINLVMQTGIFDH